MQVARQVGHVGGNRAGNKKNNIIKMYIGDAPDHLLLMEILRSPKASDAKFISTETLIQCTEVFAKICYRGRVTLF